MLQADANSPQERQESSRIIGLLVQGAFPSPKEETVPLLAPQWGHVYVLCLGDTAETMLLRR